MLFFQNDIDDYNTKASISKFGGQRSLLKEVKRCSFKTVKVVVVVNVCDMFFSFWEIITFPDFFDF